MSRTSAHPPIGPVDASVVPRFAGPETFARLPRIDQVEQADVTVVGFPFDSGVSYRPGARFGPQHVRQSSKLLRPYHPPLDVHPFHAQQVADAGDVGINPFSIDDAVATVERAADELREPGSTLLSVGGDHTIALPLLRSVARTHGPVAVLHFDAHLDTWDTYFGAPTTHGTPFRRASEEGPDRPRAQHARRHPRPALLGQGPQRRRHPRLPGGPQRRLPARRARGCRRAVRTRLADGPVYVSVDIDVLDPAHAPGTGTPEAGGLTSRELLHTLRSLAGTNVVGADIVEVAPAYDHAEITGIAAAHVAYELLAVLAVRS